MVEKIISGGLTGVDRAALDTALKLGIPCGGGVRGRWGYHQGGVSGKARKRQANGDRHPREQGQSVREHRKNPKGPDRT
jgi:Circularly permutated YpsA SLOG family